jgi:Lrp/AsnC family transcriptional regulator, regulator for asnA, asnC and gidA
LRNRTTIDVTDAKILKTLLMESRTSFTEIAKDCKISVGAVRKRYKRLRKTGIINGEIMQVNPTSVGYKCIANIGVITAKEDESKVIEFLKSKPYSCVVFKNLFERINIATIISLHAFEELSGTMREIEANPLIKHANALIWSKTSGLDRPENLILTPSFSENEIEQHPKPDTTNLEKAKIDKTDRQIAKILSQNSRTPFTKIAEELNISTKNVIQRYTKLKGTMLASSTITVNLKKLGYNAMAHLLIKVANRSKTPEILDKMLQIPNLITVMELFGGEYDLFPIIVLRDYEELFKLKKQINTIQGIEQSDMILSEPYYAWPLNLFTSLLDQAS